MNLKKHPIEHVNMNNTVNEILKTNGFLFPKIWETRLFGPTLPLKIISNGR